jgi:hypothetical protein
MIWPNLSWYDIVEYALHWLLWSATWVVPA